MSTHWGVDILLCPPTGGWTYDFCFFRRPASHLVSRHFRQQFLSYLYNFPKNFPSPKMLAILIFRIFASISLTVRDRAISSKFSTHRVSKECNLCNFQKNFPSPKMAAILIFRIFAQNGKYKFASISLTVRDRAISSKFSTHRVYKECNLCNFQKNFPSPKMAAILNFRIFAKNGKTRICFYLLNRVR